MSYSLEHIMPRMHGQVMTIGLSIANHQPVNLTSGLTQLNNFALEVMNETGMSPSVWRNCHTPQDVFIEPIAQHAFIKLQSAVSLFCTAAYTNNLHTLKHAMHSIEHYTNVIAQQYVEKSKPRALTATDGEAKAPLVAKSTRKKGKK